MTTSSDPIFPLWHLSLSGVTEIGVVTLAPRRRSAAWAAAQRYVLLAGLAGFFAGALVAGATHNKSDHTSAPGIAAGIAFGAVLLGLLLWRAESMRLVIDHPHKTLTIRNLWRTETVTASEMADIEEESLTGTGGAGSYIDWRIQDGALPPGLTISAGGLLAGTPTAAGKFTFEIGLESAGIPGATTYVLTVAPPAPTVTSISPKSGKSRGGTVVTVRGANLTGAQTVLFGSKRGVHVVVISSSELKVTSPKGHGTVAIRVVTRGGTSAQSTKDKFKFT